MLILEPVKACEPERGLGVVQVEANDFIELFDSAIDGFGLAGGFAGVAEAAQVNVAEKAASLRIVWIALKQCLCFDLGFVNALRLPVHFGEAFADYRRL